jgi:hypothetical protein
MKTGGKKNQFECLCLVNTAWGKESKDFALRFTHPKLALYLYELNRGLVFNKESPAAKHYEFWFNTEQKRETVRERALKFIEGAGIFYGAGCGRGDGDESGGRGDAVGWA